MDVDIFHLVVLLDGLICLALLRVMIRERKYPAEDGRDTE